MVYCSAMKDSKILNSDEWKGRVCMIKIYLKVVEINSFFRYWCKYISSKIFIHRTKHPG